MTSIQIQPLASGPELIPVCARWNIDAFGESTGWTLKEVVTGLQKIIEPGSGEMAFIAHHDGEPAGFVLLIDCDLETHSHLKPWLASLVVAEEFRRKGIGSALVAAVEAAARHRGEQQLYLFTATPEYYRPLGWQLFEPLEKSGVSFEIMSKRLQVKDS